MSAELTEADLAEMEERARHRVEPWRPRAREEVQMREDNRKLIEEVMRLRGLAFEQKTGPGYLDPSHPDAPRIEAVKTT